MEVSLSSHQSEQAVKLFASVTYGHSVYSMAPLDAVAFPINV